MTATSKRKYYLEPAEFRAWYAFDVALPASYQRADLYDSAFNALDWLYDNSTKRYFHQVGADVLIFRLESREDRDLLSLHWSSL